MPLFPPVTDTLRWDDLVRQGRAQLPLVSPEWTDQNVSDPGIALLELISWLVETDSYRSGAVSDRERRLLLALAGYAPLPARPATCLVRVVAAAGTLAPRGLTADGDRGGEFVPLVLADDIAVTGARIAARARASAAAEADGYRSGCHDLTREHTAGRVLLPLGPDPAPGDGLLLGLAAAGGLAAGTLDLWLVPGAGTSAPETPSDAAVHHSAVTVWECWDGTAWATPAEVVDDTAALTRAGRVRLTLPALAESGLGDQASGVLAGRTLVWLRCRLASGRHDVAPTLIGLYTDVGTAIAAHPYPDTGAAAGTELGVAVGVPGETMRLPQPWCGTPPELWLGTPAGPEPVPLVADLAHAGPTLLAATIDPDGITVRFGDGRRGRTLPPGATVLATGTWTTAAGVSEVRPPVTVVPSPAAAVTALELVASLQPGRPGEDVAEVAARAEADLWVHDRLTEAVARRRATSLDDLPLEAVRTLGVPERAVTALDLERLALSTPGVALWRARALPQVDPRLPGLKADGCVTVVVVPQLPVAAPEPTAGALSRVRARLAAARTVGTRFFVVGPTYVRVGVQAILVLRPGYAGDQAISDAALAVRTFLHPVTGGPAGRGWPFGRAVRRTELLQLLDGLPSVDRVEGLALSRTLADGTTCADCGDIALGPIQLALADTVVLTATKGVIR
jgi:hypothetical protein